MKNKLSSFLTYIIFFPLLCSALGLLGIPIGIFMVFFKTGNLNFNLKDEPDVIFFYYKNRCSCWLYSWTRLVDY